jgi:hypothetical protein
MYRHSGGLSIGAKNNAFLRPLPAHEEQSASESEAETIAELERKRRQLDEEVAQFKTQKDKEFRDFEHDLRRKRKRKRSPVNGDSHSHNARTTSTDSSVLTLLGSGSKPQANGHAHKQNQHHTFGPKLSRPTLSVEKLTILGTTVPPATAENPPSVLVRSLTGAKTPQSTHSEKAAVLSSIGSTPSSVKQEPPSTPIARDHNDPFAGVFTPSYLPLLDSRSSSTNSVQQTQKPTSQVSSAPAAQTSQHGCDSSSLPSGHISPRITSPAKRYNTMPAIPSTSLPSALRAVSAESSSTKKRKHVTFRLADSAVVEPSSSYEEMSSPDLSLERNTATGKAKANISATNGVGGGIDAVLSSDNYRSWGQGKMSPIVETANTIGLVGDDEDEDDEDEAPLTMRSINRSKHDKYSTLDLNTGTGFSFEEAPDGGSGVGFFELEEELQSPAMSPRRSPNRNRFGYFDDWGAEPDEEDHDKDKDIDRDTEMLDSTVVETKTTEEDLAAEMEKGDGDDTLNDDDENMEKDTGTTYTGLGIATAAARKGNGESSSGSTFASGSVPIDIVVRPSSSWVGSLGAGSMGKESDYVP